MNPELDKLASAAIDGEATQAEVAEFSNNPGFVAAKAELQLASDLVSHADTPSAPAGLAESQISVAMDVFRAEAARQAVKAADPSRAQTSRARKSASQSRKRSWSMPGWLSPALLSIAVIAGVGYAASNLSTGSDDSATSSDAAMEAAPATTSAMADSADATAAMEGALAEMDDSAGVSEAVEQSSEQPTPIDLSGSYFVSSRNLKANDVAALATAPVPPIAPESYDRCSEIHGFFAPQGELTLVIPFLYENEPAELLVYSDGLDLATELIVNDSCEVLDQS